MSYTKSMHIMHNIYILSLQCSDTVFKKADLNFKSQMPALHESYQRTVPHQFPPFFAMAEDPSRIPQKTHRRDSVVQILCIGGAPSGLASFLEGNG